MKDVKTLAIGGVGGSGTRVVADVVRGLGVFIGDNLNPANDNLNFPGLDRIISVSADRVHPTLVAAEVVEFERTMNEGFREHPECNWGWGWKNPPNYLFLKEFADHFPCLRYVHVIRNGLDMALSSNTRQVRQWGHLFGVSYGTPTRIDSLLEFWIKANDFAIDTAASLLGDRFMLLNFDEMCHAPIRTITALAHHLELEPPALEIDALAAIVSAPSSIGRSNSWRFSYDDKREVARFGFETRS